ncbi:MAG: hypothetical protein K5871_03510 [Lachnospiraceae bacterium]|nr:hypothetical protein [Lachnospiraceae bacterium]
MDREQIPYSEWVECIKASVLKGRKSPEFSRLLISDPVVAGDGLGIIIRNEIAKLETVLLRSAADDFQSSVNKCFEDHDLFLFEKGLRDFKKVVRDCLFFDGISALPAETKNDLRKEISNNLSAFVEEFSKYMRRLSEYEGDAFVGEFFYMYKKSNLKKFIEEQVSYE